MTSSHVIRINSPLVIIEDAALRGLAMTASTPHGANLAEASPCVALEAVARESSRRGGQTLSLSSLPPPTLPALPSC